MTFPPDVSQSDWNKVLAQTEQAKRDAVYDAAMVLYSGHDVAFDGEHHVTIQIPRAVYEGFVAACRAKEGHG